MANDRLRSAIASAGLTTSQLGERIAVDPKTVERWISNGRMPHRSNRQRVAAALRQDEAYLWPEAFNDVTVSRVSQAEVVGVYPNRGSISTALWQNLFDNAVESIDILAFAASFLHDTMPEVDDQLVAKARAGVRVRLAFGDPECVAVALRGEDEGIGMSLSDRCRLTWKYVEPLLAVPELELRRHDTTLYCSMFRFDDHLLANHHLYGAPANHSPVLHVRRLVGGRLFDHHLRSFEKVWSAAQPAGE